MTGLFEGQRGNTQAIDKRPREIKQAELKKQHKEKRSWSLAFWKNAATKVNEERYNYYLSKGNLRKADIYGRKIGKV